MKRNNEDIFYRAKLPEGGDITDGFIDDSELKMNDNINTQNKYMPRKSQRFYLPFKRIIGLFGSVLGFLICSLLLWWWVIPINAIVTKGHPLFIRHRIEKDGKPFKLFKFRSMKNDTDPYVSSTSGDHSCNITGFGKFLRVTSIDETIQLFNIFAGQMAFIGPRPFIDVNPEDALTISKRKENGSICLRPGLSGYAQIHTRAKLDPEKSGIRFSIFAKTFTLVQIFVYTLLTAFGISKGR